MLQLIFVSLLRICEKNVFKVNFLQKQSWKVEKTFNNIVSEIKLKVVVPPASVEIDSLTFDCTITDNINFTQLQGHWQTYSQKRVFACQKTVTNNFEVRGSNWCFPEIVAEGSSFHLKPKSLSQSTSPFVNEIHNYNKT